VETFVRGAGGVWRPAPNNALANTRMSRFSNSHWVNRFHVGLLTFDCFNRARGCPPDVFVLILHRVRESGDGSFGSRTELGKDLGGESSRVWVRIRRELLDELRHQGGDFRTPLRRDAAMRWEGSSGFFAIAARTGAAAAAPGPMS
jgi:hypothetical protein